jgi:hypothetical protein
LHSDRFNNCISLVLNSQFALFAHIEFILDVVYLFPLSGGMQRRGLDSSGSGEGLVPGSYERRKEYLNLPDRTNKCTCIKHVLSHIANYQHFSIAFAIIMTVAVRTY